MLRPDRAIRGTIFALTLTTGCGALPMASPTGVPATAQTLARDASGPLLYVAHLPKHGKPTESVVSILSLPQDKLLAEIRGYGYIDGVCSDRSGNVWMSSDRDGRWRVDEFARGGTKAIGELPAPDGFGLAGCAVDRRDGDLAVTGSNIDGDPHVLIWKGARAGKPAMYRVPFPASNAAYDDSGDLFVTGPAGGSLSEYVFAFGELAKGSGAFERILLDKRTGLPGGVQWDGAYIVIATTTSPERRDARLYRVKVSGTKGTVVGVVRPESFYVFAYPSSSVFVLHDGIVIGTARRNGNNVLACPYPEGGKPTSTVAKYGPIRAIALSYR